MFRVMISAILLSSTLFLVGCGAKKANVENPWVDCGKNIEQASEVAGFYFPLDLSEYNVRATRGMIEFTYQLDDKTVVIRKSKDNEGNKGDVSGDYTKYPVNKQIRLSNGVAVNVRGEEDLFYVMHLESVSGYYSASSKDGLKYNDLDEIYSEISLAEAPKVVD